MFHSVFSEIFTRGYISRKISIVCLGRGIVPRFPLVTLITSLSFGGKESKDCGILPAGKFPQVCSARGIVPRG